MTDENRITIKAADAAELYSDMEGRPGDTSGPWTLVINTEDAPHSRTSRWHEKYWLVVHNAEGDAYGLEYGIGLTENQEDYFPWEGVSDDLELPLTRLYAHTVTTVVYRREPAKAGA
jgi:hypothetical protein